MLKKSVLGIILALAITACTLIFATSAAEPLTLSVAASGGDYTTVESALTAVESMAKKDEIPAEGVRLVLTGQHSATKKDNLLFGQKTIFFKDGKKVPITITGGTLLLPGAKSNYRVSCANDYRFENLSMGITEETCYLHAGSGNVTFSKIDFGTTVTTKLRFFGDTDTGNVFDGWTEESLALYSVDGLFRASMTLENMEYYDVGAYLAAAVGSSQKFTTTVGNKTVTQADQFPALYLNNMKMGIIASRFGSNNAAKALMSVHGGQYDYLRGVSKPSTNTNTFTGDVFLEFDGVSTSHLIRLFYNNNIVGNVSVKFKNIDLTSLDSSNNLIQILYQNSSITGSLSVSMDNVKTGRYLGANLGTDDNAFLNGDLSVTATNCTFSSQFYSGISIKGVAGSITNTLTNCNLPADFRGAGDAAWVGDSDKYTGSEKTVGHITNRLTDCTFAPVPDGGNLYLGSGAGCTVAGDIVNDLKNTSIEKVSEKAEQCSFYTGCRGGEVKGTVKNTLENCLIGPEFFGSNYQGNIKHVENHIKDVEFLGYAHLAGRSPTVTGNVVNHIENAIFAGYYLYCGTSGGTVTNTATISNYVSDGSFKGFWGGSAGRSTNFRGNIYNEISGGTFNIYSSDFYNSFSGGCRNPSHLEGNVTTKILGGTFEGFVTGGSIPHNDPLNFHDNPGKTSLTLAGGTFLHDVLAGSRWGTYAEENMWIDTTEGKEPLSLTKAVFPKSVTVKGAYDCIISAPVTTESITVDGSKLKIYSEVTADTVTFLSGPMPTVYDGHLICNELTLNGSEIGLGSKGRITAKSVTGGSVKLYQEEIWLRQTYFTAPADTLIFVRSSEDSFNFFIIENGVVRGKANALESASLLFENQVSMRFAFNPDFVEEVGDNFSFTATIGTQTIAQAKRSDLVEMTVGENRYYTFLSQPILAGNLGQKIQVSGMGIYAKAVTPAELAAAGITVYDKVSQSTHFANLLRAFANYATACHNKVSGENVALPYPSLATPTGKTTSTGPLYDPEIPKAETKDSYVKFTGSGTGRQLILGDDIRIRYQGRISPFTDITKNDLTIICNSVDITSSCNLTQSGGIVSGKTITFEIPVLPTLGSDDLRIIVRRGSNLCHDYVERADCLAEELKAADPSYAQLADSVLYYLQAAKEYRLNYPLLNKVSYPDTFAAGYGRADISPYGTKILMNTDTYAFEVSDPIYATCTALWDGEEIALLYTLDTRQCPSSLTNKGKNLLAKELGINPDNVFFNASHNHSSPTTTVPSHETIKPWLDEIYYPGIVIAAKLALMDLAPVKEAYHSNADTPPGSNFVRRYLLESGVWSGIHNYYDGTSPIVAHESEADKNLRVVYFEREGAKDILWANWQGHAAHGAGGPTANKVTADIVNLLRKNVEETLDVHFSYFNGASGNINFTPKLYDKEGYLLDENANRLLDENGQPVKKFTSPYFNQVATEALYPTVIKALQTKQPLALGKVQSLFVPYEATYRIDDPEKIERAFEAYDNENYHGIAPELRETPCAECTEKGIYHGKKDKAELCKTYGFGSFYEVGVVVSRENGRKANPSKTTHEITLWVFSCGDLGMFFAPYEMFDSDAIKVRSASPFEMTFSCGYTNGTYSYMPDDDVHDHGGYEVYTCQYAKGTSTGCNKNMIDGLNTLYSQR